jgi:hypothetical protein
MKDTSVWLNCSFSKKNFKKISLSDNKVIAKILYMPRGNYCGLICGEDESYYEAKMILLENDLDVLKFKLNLKLAEDNYKVKIIERQ